MFNILIKNPPLWVDDVERREGNHGCRHNAEEAMFVSNRAQEEIGKSYHGEDTAD